VKTATARPSKIVPRPGVGTPTGKREPAQFRSRDWMAAVASLEFCVLCGRYGVQVAHRNEGKAKGRKVDDCLTGAICPICHSEIDQGAHLTRDQRRALMDKAIVLTVLALVRAGKLQVSA
jgi:hypothetical protein